jgi:hypothetical protein
MKKIMRVSVAITAVQVVLVILAIGAGVDLVTSTPGIGNLLKGMFE